MRVPALAFTLSALVLAAGCGAGIGSIVQPGTSKLEVRLIAANPSDGFKVPTWDGKTTMVVEKRVHLNDKDVEKVKRSKLPDGSPSVDLVFDQTASLALEDLTAKNVGRTVAILVDGKIVIAPTVKERISEGHVTLAGFDAAQADVIYARLKK
jgi:preprotein translocase subunit SecD